MDISAREYQQFRELLEANSGILLGDNKQYLVVSRLSSFLREQQIESFSELLRKISSPAGRRLLSGVIDRMTTNETLWFRDRYPFDFLKNNIIKQCSSPVKIWCAACSSGQEPYSVAMALDEIGRLANVELIATDLSESMIKRASEGKYQQIELNRGLGIELLRRYFSECADGMWQINERIRRRIQFRTMNLLQMPYTIKNCDVIFCRNVLIYFSNENKSRVINALVDSLKPGGYLFLGASESLPRDTKPLDMIRCQPGLAFRKPL